MSDKWDIVDIKEDILYNFRNVYRVYIGIGFLDSFDRKMCFVGGYISSSITYEMLKGLPGDYASELGRLLVGDMQKNMAEIDREPYI